VITLVSLWENGWLDPEVEAFAWKQMSSAYSVDDIVFSPYLLQRRLKPRQAKTMDEALGMVTGELVFLIPEIGTPLDKFDHPEEAVYIFGNAKQGNRDVVDRHGGYVVHIPTPKQVDIFGINAAAIVLADRERKRNVS